MALQIPSVLQRPYLFVREQVRHAQALWAHARRSAAAAPDPRFVLFGRGRSGTTALVSLLDAVPAIRCEGEILRDWVPYPMRHVLGRSRWRAAAAYGCKILSYQLRDVQRALPAPENFLRTLHCEHGFRVLYLRRANLLRHALSNIRARRDTFHRKKGDRGGASALTVDPEHVVAWMESSAALRAYEHRLLAGLPHLSLTYEHDLRDAEAHPATVDSVCDYLGVPSAPAESEYRKVAPRSLRESVANYEALARRLTGTRFEPYLE